MQYLLDFSFLQRSYHIAGCIDPFPPTMPLLKLLILSPHSTLDIERGSPVRKRRHERLYSTFYVIKHIKSTVRIFNAITCAILCEIMLRRSGGLCSKTNNRNLTIH